MKGFEGLNKPEASFNERLKARLDSEGEVSDWNTHERKRENEALKESSQIEYALENPEDIAQGTHASGNAHTRKLRSFIAAGTLAAGSAAGEAQIHSTEKATEAKMVRAEEIVNEHLGLDIEKLREGFDVTVQIDRGHDGHYIIHLGQRHIHPISERNTDKIVSNVIDTQKRIEETISDLKRRGAEGIFSEGATEFMKFYRARSASTGNDVIKGIARDLSEGMRYAEKVFNEATKTLDQKEASVDPEALADLLAVYRVIEQINNDPEAKKFTQKNGKASQVMEMIYQSYTSGGLDRVLLYGGALKLYIDGQIELIPTEEVEDKNRDIAISALNRMDEIIAELGKLEDDGLSDSEKARSDKLWAEAEKLKKEFLDNADEPRENKVLTKIVEGYKRVGKAKFIPLVFGDAHDFTNNVEEHNRNNTEKEPDFGLIKLSPKASISNH